MLLSVWQRHISDWLPGKKGLFLKLYLACSILQSGPFKEQPWALQGHCWGQVTGFLLLQTQGLNLIAHSGSAYLPTFLFELNTPNEKTLKTSYSPLQHYNLSQACRPSLEALVELNFHISVFARICPSAMLCRHTGSKNWRLKGCECAGNCSCAHLDWLKQDEIYTSKKKKNP